MARAAILMAVLCIGFAAHAMGSAVREGWRILADNGLIPVAAETAQVIRVVRQLPGTIPDRPQHTLIRRS
jgi:hypothetical protein